MRQRAASSRAIRGRLIRLNPTRRNRISGRRVHRRRVPGPQIRSRHKTPGRATQRRSARSQRAASGRWTNGPRSKSRWRKPAPIQQSDCAASCKPVASYRRAFAPATHKCPSPYANPLVFCRAATHVATGATGIRSAGGALSSWSFVIIVARSSGADTSVTLTRWASFLRTRHVHAAEERDTYRDRFLLNARSARDHWGNRTC